MSSIAALWLPILLSAVFVFVASSIIHTLLPWHKGDYRQVPNQDAVMDALRPHAIPPGDYMVPRAASGAEMKSPEFAEKLRKGPVLVVTVMTNGPWMMGSTFVYWFLYLLVVSVLSSHVAALALPKGADTREIFHTIALTAFAGYGLALWQLSIWYRRSWTTTLKATIDAIIYAAITGITFAWLWPK